MDIPEIPMTNVVAKVVERDYLDIPALVDV
jgi:hypothetical protein